MTNLYYIVILVLIFKSGLVHSEAVKTIQKCCQEGYSRVYGLEFCFKNPSDKKFCDVQVFNKQREYTGKNVSEMFKIIPHPNITEILKKNTTKPFPFRYKHNISSLIYDDGTADIKCEDAYCNLTNDHFCLEYVLYRNRNKMVAFLFPLYDENQNQNQMTIKDYLEIAALCTSSFCLLLVLAVYAMLRELRTLGGLILMATVVSLMIAFLLLAILKSLSHNDLTDSDNVCKGFSFTIYFAFLAAFFWMNIMSFDIWWTFRGFVETRPLHRRGINHKFLMYSIYAWGGPALMATGAAILNEIGLKQPTTWQTLKIDRNNCFLRENGRIYYLFVPMLILFTANCMFYIMTACSIRNLQRGIAMLDQRGKNNQKLHKFRFLVYIKLFMVMGISWLLEVISTVWPHFAGFYISDAYNCLTGVFIFIIFVCKRKIWKGLKKRFARPLTSSGDRRSSKFRFISYSSSSAAYSDSEQHSAVVVCMDPKGNEKFN